MSARPNPRMNFYLRLDAKNRVIAGTGVWRFKQPKTGNWKLIPQTDADLCCGYTTAP
jgi:hypothetical protein